ncbi:MAG: nitroreductase family protein [Candidatus Omnitrophota bacterium]
MKFLDLVKKRRSVRQYLKKPVPREVIERALEAARFAPSACNSQPWYFVVIDDEANRKAVAEAAFSGAHSMNAFAKDAPVLIAVIRRKSTYAASLGSAFRGLQFSLIDIGISCEHLTLQAEEDGVGSCWIGWFNESAVKRALNISKNEKIDILISLGYPADEIPREKNRKSIDEIRRYFV